MRSASFAVVLCTLLLAFPPASACWTTSVSEYNGCSTVGTIGTDDLSLPCYYVDYDPILGGVYVYRESNNIAGLQRADSGRDDTCSGFITSDHHVA